MDNPETNTTWFLQTICAKQSIWSSKFHQHFLRSSACIRDSSFITASLLRFNKYICDHQVEVFKHMPTLKILLTFEGAMPLLGETGRGKRQNGELLAITDLDHIVIWIMKKDLMDLQISLLDHSFIPMSSSFFHIILMSSHCHFTKSIFSRRCSINHIQFNYSMVIIYSSN